DVHVAYQTSGNIAVSDKEALKFAEISKRIYKSTEAQEIIDNIKAKKESSFDSKRVLRLKGDIRRGESYAAVRYLGLDDANAHFLDLQFYETGRVKKNQLSEKDIEIIVDIIKEIKPHQIYAAGDLADPHGTHKVCLDAIFAALERLKTEPFMKDCWVWLYRGAWHEWDTHEIEMAVPMSPGQVLRKRNAIFAHQSQKDGVMFQGDDSREFWMRAEERNKETANRYHALGLADYAAMEAFVRYRFL
ncbi:MAG: glucosamine-6-phosphate deaminase, partial [Pricia sp.]